MKANNVDVAIVPHPFAVERVHHSIAAGRSVADIIYQLQPDAVLVRHAHVYLNGDYIPQEQWSNVTPKAGAILSIRLVPMGGGGGKNALRTVLSLAVMVAAPNMIPAGMTFMGLNISAGLATGVNLLTRLAMNALAPPPRPRFSSGGKESPSLFIQGARNQASPFARVPKILGKHRFVPPLGAFPYTETVGND